MMPQGRGATKRKAAETPAPAPSGKVIDSGSLQERIEKSIAEHNGVLGQIEQTERGLEQLRNVARQLEGRIMTLQEMHNELNPEPEAEPEEDAGG
jgi:predicted nuclease with TOPRIM domain